MMGLLDVGRCFSQSAAEHMNLFTSSLLLDTNTSEHLSTFSSAISPERGPPAPQPACLDDSSHGWNRSSPSISGQGTLAYRTLVSSR